MTRWSKLMSMAMLAGLSGCSTIMHPDGRQAVAITSQPPGAEVTVNGAPQGTTPVSVQLDRRQEYAVGLHKAGYEPYQQVLAKHLDPLFFVNILFIPGVLVDIATGSDREFPGQVQGLLVPPKAARREGGGAP